MRHKTGGLALAALLIGAAAGGAPDAAEVAARVAAGDDALASTQALRHSAAPSRPRRTATRRSGGWRAR